jgi:hypothetical protein
MLVPAMRMAPVAAIIGVTIGESVVSIRTISIPISRAITIARVSTVAIRRSIVIASLHQQD